MLQEFNLAIFHFHKNPTRDLPANEIIKQVRFIAAVFTLTRKATVLGRVSLGKILKSFLMVSHHCKGNPQLCYSLVEIKAFNFNIMDLLHQHGQRSIVSVTILRQASRVVPFGDSVTIKVLSFGRMRVVCRVQIMQKQTDIIAYLFLSLPSISHFSC